MNLNSNERSFILTPRVPIHDLELPPGHVSDREKVPKRRGTKGHNSSLLSLFLCSSKISTDTESPPVMCDSHPHVLSTMESLFIHKQQWKWYCTVTILDWGLKYTKVKFLRSTVDFFTTSANGRVVFKICTSKGLYDRLSSAHSHPVFSVYKHIKT